MARPSRSKLQARQEGRLSGKDYSASKNLVGDPGTPVIVEYDLSQGTTDKYGRTLAYVWTESATAPGTPATLTSTAMVVDGRAEEYVYSEDHPDAHHDAIHRAAEAA